MVSAWLRKAPIVIVFCAVMDIAFFLLSLTNERQKKKAIGSIPAKLQRKGRPSCKGRPAYIFFFQAQEGSGYFQRKVLVHLGLEGGIAPFTVTLVPGHQIGGTIDIILFGKAQNLDFQPAAEHLDAIDQMVLRVLRVIGRLVQGAGNAVEINIPDQLQQTLLGGAEFLNRGDGQLWVVAIFEGAYQRRYGVFVKIFNLEKGAPS